MAWIFATVASLMVLGLKILRILCRYLVMALSGTSTFGTIFPFPPIALMIQYPRNLKPSVIWVTFVFSS